MTGDRGQRAGRWRQQLPEPDLGWIRWTPQPWAGPESGVWTDLGQGGLGWGRGGEGAPSGLPAVSADLDDVVYLPPTTLAGRPQRLAAAMELTARGTPSLVQLLPGDEWPAESGGTVVYDLLPGLWHGDTESLERLPAGGAAIWPLIRGVTDDERLVARGLEVLREGGVTTAVGMPLELSPANRREVVRTHGDEVFDLIFHGEGASARRFAAAADRAGLQWWLERPLPSSSRGACANRRLSGVLLTLGSLRLQIDDSPVRGQAFYRAARWIDSSQYDVVALLREGNLEVVEAVDPTSREVLREVLDSGRCTLVDELRSRYLDATVDSGEKVG